MLKLVLSIFYYIKRKQKEIDTKKCICDIINEKCKRNGKRKEKYMHPFKKQIYITCGILFAVICGILIYPKRTEAAIKDINPNVFIYTEGASSASSWYDTSSDCFIFQMLEKKRSSTNYYQTYVYDRNFPSSC